MRSPPRLPPRSISPKKTCRSSRVEDKTDQIKAASKAGWVNELSLDDLVIRESNDDPVKMAKMAKYNEKDWLPRPTFMKMEDALGNVGYRFIGVYKRRDGDSTNPRLYKRISDYFEWAIEKAEEARQHLAAKKG